jgi:hypothetical protein
MPQWWVRVVAFASAAYYAGFFAVWWWEVHRGYFDAPLYSLVIPGFFLVLACIAAYRAARRRPLVLWISNLPVLAFLLLGSAPDWKWWMGLPLSVTASVISLWVPTRSGHLPGSAPWP